MAEWPARPPGEPPQNFASVPPPQDLYPTSDIRIVMIELGRVGSKLDRLISDIEKLDVRIGPLERSVDRVRTGAIVAAAILSIVFGIFWWALGDRITNAVRTGLLGEGMPLQQQPQSTTGR